MGNGALRFPTWNLKLTTASLFASAVCSFVTFRTCKEDVTVLHSYAVRKNMAKTRLKSKEKQKQVSRFEFKTVLLSRLICDTAAGKDVVNDKGKFN